jgi:hypothetical protein
MLVTGGQGLSPFRALEATVEGMVEDAISRIPAILEMYAGIGADVVEA